MNPQEAGVGLLIVTLGLMVIPFMMCWRSLRAAAPIWVEGPIVAMMKEFESGRIYQAAALHAPPYSVLTHTPLSYLISYAAWSLWPHLSSLRLVNMAFTLGCTVLICIFVRGEGPSRWIAPVFAGCSFWLCQPVFVWSQVARSPDSLEALFAVATLLATLHMPRGWKRDAVIGTLFALAVLSKQTAVLVLIPTLFWHEGKLRSFYSWALRLCFAGVVLGPVIMVLQVRTHGGFLFDVVRANFARHFWQHALLDISIPLVPLWFFAALTWRFTPAPRSIAHKWFLMSLIVGMLTCTKLGSDAMYFFDFSAATAILAGISVQRFYRGSSKSTDYARAGALIAIALLFMGIVGDLHYFSLNDSSVVRGYEEAITALRCVRGDILAEDATIPITLGRRWWWDDPFVYGELERRGTWHDEQIRSRLNRRDFSAIVVRDLRFWPLSLRAAVLNSYYAGPSFHCYYLAYVIYLPKH